MIQKARGTIFCSARTVSADPESKHGFCHLEKARDICPGNQVSCHAELRGGVCRVVIDVDHNIVQFGVYLLKRPGVAHAVLAHFKGRSRHAARVCRLAGAEEYALFNKISLFKIKFEEDKCVRCGKCVKTCKMDVDVTKNPQHTECIRCGDCIKACPVKALSYNFGLDLKKEGKLND